MDRRKVSACIQLTTWDGAACAPRDTLHSDDWTEILRFATDAVDHGLRVQIEKVKDE